MEQENNTEIQTVQYSYISHSASILYLFALAEMEVRIVFGFEREKNKIKNKFLDDTCIYDNLGSDGNI